MIERKERKGKERAQSTLTELNPECYLYTSIRLPPPQKQHYLDENSLSTLPYLTSSHFISARNAQSYIIHTYIHTFLSTPTHTNRQINLNPPKDPSRKTINPSSHDPSPPIPSIPTCTIPSAQPSSFTWHSKDAREPHTANHKRQYWHSYTRRSAFPGPI